MIYLDGAATMLPYEEVLEDYVDMSRHCYNPSSTYQDGYYARWVLDKAREVIAHKINCDPDEVIFTSGGTEGNNMLIRGWKDGVLAQKGIRRHTFVTSQIEHPSILETAYYNLGLDGRFHVYYSPVWESGIIDIQSLDETLRAEKNDGGHDLDLMVSLQYANNEIGTMQYINVLSGLVHSYGGFFHTDAVQAFPHFKIDVKALGIDSMTVSGHKFGALRGSGFIYISKALQEVLMPLMRGGQQEFGFRAGTEDVASCHAMARRIIDLYDEFPLQNEGKYLLKKLDESGIEYRINGESDIGIYSITLPGIKASELVVLLDEDGICVSTGSACHNYSPKPSHVLKAIGLSDEDARATIRVCLDGIGRDDIDYFVERLCFNIRLLRGDA